MQSAAWPGTAEQDGGSCNPCPRLLLKLTETICGHQSLSRAPGDSGGWGSESPSPRRGHGQHCPPGRPPSSRREEMGSQLPLERDQERFRLLSSFPALFFLSCSFPAGSAIGPLLVLGGQWGCEVGREGDGDERGKLKSKHVWKGHFDVNGTF